MIEIVKVNTLIKVKNNLKIKKIYFYFKENQVNLKLLNCMNRLRY
jgi:hypothetical protein